MPTFERLAQFDREFVTFAWGWFPGADQLPLWRIWDGLWAAAAVVVVAATGFELTRQALATPAASSTG